MVLTHIQHSALLHAVLVSQPCPLCFFFSALHLRLCFNQCVQQYKCTYVTNCSYVYHMYYCILLQVFIGIPIMMVFVAIFLVFLPIIREPVHSIVAFSLILSGIPVYFIFIHEHKWRPKIFTRINGKACCKYTVFVRFFPNCSITDHVLWHFTEHILVSTTR